MPSELAGALGGWGFPLHCVSLCTAGTARMHPRAMGTVPDERTGFKRTRECSSVRVVLRVQVTSARVCVCAREHLSVPASSVHVGDVHTSV